MALSGVEIISLGGTIAMAGRSAGGVVPTLTAGDLIEAVPQLAQVATLSARSLRLLPGWHLTIADLLALAAEIRQRIEAGVDGIVVTQGTDTIEEIAFGLDLLVAGETPVVVAGAMRNPTLPGADGPANLLAAVQVAASPQARGLGALVVLNDEIHAARWVHKAHTQNPATFSSPLVGPIGWVAEGSVRIVARPVGRRHVTVDPQAPECPVALLKVALGDDGRLLGALDGLGYRGLVVEGFGGGHVPPAWVGALTRLAQQMPVVRASRTGSGEVLRRTYAPAGSETDLRARDLIDAGWLDGLKARLLLTLLLQGGAHREEIAGEFAIWGRE